MIRTARRLNSLRRSLPNGGWRSGSTPVRAVRIMHSNPCYNCESTPSPEKSKFTITADFA